MTATCFRTSLLIAALLVAPLCVTGVQAQETILLEGVDEMDFDRPESWALKYFTSVSLMTGLGTPERSERGAFELGFEAVGVPHLSSELRRVGFLGDKVEDLNRTSVLGRLRASFGLPAAWTASIGVTPPVEVDGVTPRLLTLALARPVYESDALRLGLRLHGQLGDLEGDLTCPADVAGVADPEINPDGCVEPSNDEATLEYVALELSASPRIRGDRWQPHVALTVTRMDLEFQVRARYSILDDRVLLRTDGSTVALAAGAAYRFSPTLSLAGELFYSPLDVVRDAASGAENDALFHTRFLLRWAVR